MVPKVATAFCFLQACLDKNVFSIGKMSRQNASWSKIRFAFSKVFRHLSKYVTTQLMNILFKALNDATRREILKLLKDGDKTAGEIAEHFHISKPSISHHLDLLKQAGLVEAEKEGQFITYSLNTTVVDEIAQWFLQFKTKKK
jgi:DNA-binding transcriptional ArsR family regulator